LARLLAKIRRILDALKTLIDLSGFNGYSFGIDKNTYPAFFTIMLPILPKMPFKSLVIFSLCLAVAIYGCLGILFWTLLSPEEKNILIDILRHHPAQSMILCVAFLIGLMVIVERFYRLYALPIDRIREEIPLLFESGSVSRLEPHGGAETRSLATALNRAADRFHEAGASLEKRIREAQKKGEDEKELLTGIIAELPEGVLVCNPQGQITLYNEKARRLMSGQGGKENIDPGGHAIDAYVGLGRSVFGLLDRSIFSYMIGEIAERMRKGQPDVRCVLSMIGKADRLLRVETAPIIGDQREIAGLVMIINDITRQFAMEDRTNKLFESMVFNIRAAVAGIRSSVEMLREHPNLEPSNRSQLLDIVHSGAISAARVLDESAADLNNRTDTLHNFSPIRIHDLIETVYKRAEEKLHLRPERKADEQDHWIRAESYSLSSALLFIMERVVEENQGENIRLSSSRHDKFAVIELCWEGRPTKVERLRQWLKQHVVVGENATPLKLGDILDRHGGEMWPFSNPARQEHGCVQIILPIADPETPTPLRRSTLLPTHRPVFFDFDLFGNYERAEEWENRNLADLAYTVFDTETTGLDPEGGDEIIAIGATRVIHGNVLEDECFEQLIDPRREIPWSSIRFHGIERRLLEGQPDIVQVLPRFHKYTEGTVLVGHNVAFDMRMLKEKEAAAGVRFDHPVLDTMLLSAVLHPSNKAHDLEEIAARLGVTVIGRHTALGDALATAEIFLKMLPLLDRINLKTLKEVRQACQKTYYARLKY
jgi:DNA polymerase-3 subunit epsilon